MTDYIERQAAIDAVLELDTTHRVSWRDAVVDMIDAMPSADVQPVVHGEWIGRGSMLIGYRCSVCDEYSIDGTDKFCSNCGADMRGEQDDES